MTGTQGRLIAGELLTREERLHSYLLRQDLQRQAERCTDPARKLLLERSLEGMERERQSDLATRRKRPRKAESRDAA